jgi:hypothetical protein
MIESLTIHIISCTSDLNYIEDAAGGPDLPVAILPKSGSVISCQMDSKLPIDMFEKVLRLAIDGCNMLYKVPSPLPPSNAASPLLTINTNSTKKVMCEEVKKRTLELYAARGTLIS